MLKIQQLTISLKLKAGNVEYALKVLSKMCESNAKYKYKISICQNPSRMMLRSPQLKRTCFQKPLISAHSPNESKFGVFCNTLSIYQENVLKNFEATSDLRYDLLNYLCKRSKTRFSNFPPKWIFNY